MEQFKVAGMHCAACSARVEQAVVTMQGGTTKPPYMDFPYQNHSGLSLLSSSISSSSGKARVRSSVKKKISS